MLPAVTLTPAGRALHSSKDIPLPGRRHFVVAGIACGAMLPALSACSVSADEQAAARALRRPMAGTDRGHALLMRELVRFATLAPSSHNTQCWTFQLQDHAIVIAPDFARRCPAVDPDDHHLHVSLGCAVENLAHAALAVGLHAEAPFDPGGDGAIRVNLDSARPLATPLFNAIAGRQCTRGDYDGNPISNEELRILEQAGTGNGVHVMLLMDRTRVETVLDYVVAANSVQLADAAFMAELKSWLRFGANEAEQSGDGLFSGASGSPIVPRWLGLRLLGMFLNAKSDNARYAGQIRSSAGIAVFVSEKNDRAHWIETGRCYERFALQATALGVRNAFVNQPVEVGEIRAQFAAALGLGARRPDLVVRFGRGPIMPLSMRRPVQSVIV